MQCLQKPSQSNGRNLNNERCEASRYFRKKKAHLKVKIKGLETKNKIENIGESIILKIVTKQVLIEKG